MESTAVDCSDDSKAKVTHDEISGVQKANDVLGDDVFAQGGDDAVGALRG